MGADQRSSWFLALRRLEGHGPGGLRQSRGLPGQFQSILRVGKEDYAVDPEGPVFYAGESRINWRPCLARRGPLILILPRHADIAAALQAATSAAVMALVRRIKRKVPFESVHCRRRRPQLRDQRSWSGNRRFLRRLHTLRAARCRHRIGAALFVHCAKQKSLPERGSSTPFLGPEFNRREILAAVKSAGLTPRRSKVPRARRCGHDRRWQDSRLVSGPHARLRHCISAAVTHWR